MGAVGNAKDSKGCVRVNFSDLCRAAIWMMCGRGPLLICGGNGRTRLTAERSRLGFDEKASRRLLCIRAVDGDTEVGSVFLVALVERGSLSADGQSHHHLALT